VVAWLRRNDGQPVPDPTAPDPGDSPAALRVLLSQAVHFLHRSAGALPGAAVVNGLRLTDTLGEIVDTSDVRPLDVYAVISVRRTLEDYLPTSLHGFLALAESLRDIPGPSGRTPAQSLVVQIDALQTSADSVLVAARAQDLDALIAQGTFLQTKFSRSDLDL
jgi:hypothetical protein